MEGFDLVAPEPASEPAMKTLPVANVHQLIEPGPVVLMSTAHRGAAPCNIKDVMLH